MKKEIVRKHPLAVGVVGLGLMGAVFVTALTSAGCGKDYQVQDSGKLEVQPPQMFFPSPLWGETTTQELLLKNSGSGVVVITDATLKEDLKDTPVEASEKDYREFGHPAIVGIADKSGNKRDVSKFPLSLKSGESLLVSVPFVARDKYPDHAKLNFTVQGVSSIPDGNLSIDLNSGGTLPKILTRNPVVFGGKTEHIEGGVEATCIDEVVENSGKAPMFVNNLVLQDPTGSRFKAYIYTQKPPAGQCNGQKTPKATIEGFENTAKDPHTDGIWDKKQLTIYPQLLPDDKKKELIHPEKNQLDKFWIRYFFYPIDETEQKSSLILAGSNIVEGNKINLIGNPSGICVSVVPAVSNADKSNTIHEAFNGITPTEAAQPKKFKLKNCSRNIPIHVSKLSFSKGNFELIDDSAVKGTLDTEAESAPFSIKVKDPTLKPEDLVNGKSFDDSLTVDSPEGKALVTVPGLIVNDKPSVIRLSGRRAQSNSFVAGGTIIELDTNQFAELKFDVDTSRSTCKASPYKPGVDYYTVTLDPTTSAPKFKHPDSIRWDNNGVITTSPSISSGFSSGQQLNWEGKDDKDSRGLQTAKWSMKIPVSKLSNGATSFSLISKFTSAISGDLFLAATITDPCGVSSVIRLDQGAHYHFKRSGKITVELTWSSQGGTPINNAKGSDVDLHVLPVYGHKQWNSPSDCFWNNIKVDVDSKTHITLDKETRTTNGPEIISINTPNTGSEYDIGAQLYKSNGFQHALVSVEIYYGDSLVFHTFNNPYPQWLSESQFWWIGRLKVLKDGVKFTTKNILSDDEQQANSDRDNVN